MTVTIEELERMCAASGSIRKVAQDIGVTKQCVSARLIKARAAVKASLEVSDLKHGEILREKETGHRWQYVGPSERLGCVRVATEGGANTMDMSLVRMERPKEIPAIEDGPSHIAAVKHVFFCEAGTYGPHTKENTALIEHALEVRRALDQEKQVLQKADPVTNLRATMRQKAEARKRLAE